MTFPFERTVAGEPGGVGSIGATVRLCWLVCLEVNLLIVFGFRATLDSWTEEAAEAVTPVDQARMVKMLRTSFYCWVDFRLGLTRFPQAD